MSISHFMVQLRQENVEMFRGAEYNLAILIYKGIERHAGEGRG